ncbi:hypothetical protein Acsp04_57910 [Actinomadura sp. NBRC 104425]|nr:hypothetical protein Acsp04_57910 [Actinomadura sp. NBRC 104425]
MRAVPAPRPHARAGRKPSRPTTPGNPHANSRKSWTQTPRTGCHEGLKAGALPTPAAPDDEDAPT